MKEEQFALLLRFVGLLEQGKLQVVESKPWKPWMGRFLEDLDRHNGNASAAIEMSSVCRDTVYRCRRDTPDFARRWEAVLEAVRERNKRRGRLRRGAQREEWAR